MELGPCRWKIRRGLSDSTGTLFRGPAPSGCITAADGLTNSPGARCAFHAYKTYLENDHETGFGAGFDGDVAGGSRLLERRRELHPAWHADTPFRYQHRQLHRLRQGLQ